MANTVRLSSAQMKLIARIRRCPRGCFIERCERRTAGKLQKAGLIDTNASFTVAWPREAK